MDVNIQKFNDCLTTCFPHIGDIKQTFMFCSKYGDGQYLVNSQTKTINFDKLTEWLNPGPSKPQSADSLSFNEDYAYLIEFKSGDPTTHERKIDRLICGVIGKINDSDKTLSALFSSFWGDNETRIKEKFCLVIDSKQMGLAAAVMAHTTILADLSNMDNDQMSEKEKIIFNKIYSDLKSGISDATHFAKIEIWYGELFDTYVKASKIKDAFDFT